MTEKVKAYLETRTIWQHNHDDFKEAEYGERLIKARKELSVEELESLKSHISIRSFWEGIVPLIEAKTGKPYSSPQATATPTKPFRAAAVKAPDKSASSNRY
jgi:hypothetical protein